MYFLDLNYPSGGRKLVALFLLCSWCHMDVFVFSLPPSAMGLTVICSCGIVRSYLLVYEDETITQPMQIN